MNCFTKTDILLPGFALDPERMSKWSCIACDQHTSEPEYWSETERVVGDAPSALRLILPEVYLSETDARFPAINAAMTEYVSNVLVSYDDSMIFLERTLADGRVRRGLVGAIDLECYDYTKGATSLVRATEGTVLERIPPRVKIREGASIELPHVMILIDDPNRTVIEPLAEQKLAGLYDFELMQGGGHVKGSLIPENEQRRICDSLDALCVGENPLLFAVGDGNHSLASAKAYWEELKATLPDVELKDHPARYALAEIVNIHDEALDFEPIYRVVFGADSDELIVALESYAASLREETGIPPQTIEYIKGGERRTIRFEHPKFFLPVGTLQSFLDSYKVAHTEIEIDYIHGVEATEKLADGEGAIGFLFDGMTKDQLFPTVISDGALPRKTFSMGEACDKRYYLEARRIVK